jgi:D-glycero-alpha-D-manno-heptose-7-phosphate kinase
MDRWKNAEASAPTRIDLAGGTLDIWPLYLFHRGALTLNMAVELRAGVSVRPRSDGVFRVNVRGTTRGVVLGEAMKRAGRGAHALFFHALRHAGPRGGMDIEFFAEAPRGAGLAGSSALLTALCGALMISGGRRISRERLVPTLRDIETGFLEVPAGVQDYYPALWGGVQALWWETGSVRREPLRLPVRELEKRMLLVYTGRSRQSGTNNWEICRRHLDGDRKTRRLLQKIASAAGDMYEALSCSDFEGVGRAMAEDAEARKRLFPGILTEEIRDLERTLKRHGAETVKVCGAGGGGCVVVYSKTDAREVLAKKIVEKGHTLLPVRAAGRGLIVRETAP